MVVTRGRTSRSVATGGYQQILGGRTRGSLIHTARVRGDDGHVLGGGVGEVPRGEDSHTLRLERRRSFRLRHHVALVT